MKKFLTVVVLVLVAVGVAGCSNNVLPDQIDRFIVPCNVVVEVGEKIPLNVKYEPNNAISNEVLYSSKNEEIAVVNGIGEIIGKSVGNTTVEVMAKRGKAKAEISVRVVNKGDKPVLLTGEDVVINLDNDGVIFTIKSNDKTKSITSDLTLRFTTKSTVSSLVLDVKKREILKVMDMRFDGKYLDYERGNDLKLTSDLKAGEITLEVISKSGITETSTIKVNM
mgnify:FL=1